MIYTISSACLKRHCFPTSVISYAIWSYHRFTLNLRDVETLLAERGITVRYQTIRMWVRKFGSRIAKRILACRKLPSDKWNMDEVVIMIRGLKHWLWSAVDSNGQVLDILVQTPRNTRAAKRFISKLVTRWGKPRVIVTDKPRSYGAALRKLEINVDYRAHKGLNNRIERSHRPIRKREKIQGKFKSACQTQRFLSVHDETVDLFCPVCHKLTASKCRQVRAIAFEHWNIGTLEQLRQRFGPLK